MLSFTSGCVLAAAVQAQPAYAAIGEGVLMLELTSGYRKQR